jgi:hypothetical protein
MSREGVPHKGDRNTVAPLGGAHEQIGGPAFDAGHRDDDAGRSCEPYASRSQNSQEQPYQEAQDKASRPQPPLPFCRSDVACPASQPAGRSVPRQCKKFRLQDMAASHGSGSRSKKFRHRWRLSGGTLEQIGYAAFDASAHFQKFVRHRSVGTGDLCAGGDSKCHACRSRNAPQQAYQEAWHKTSRRIPVDRSGAACPTSLSAKRSLPRQCPSLRVQDMAASHV